MASTFAIRRGSLGLSSPSTVVWSPFLSLTLTAATHSKPYFCSSRGSSTARPPTTSALTTSPSAISSRTVRPSLRQPTEALAPWSPPQPVRRLDAASAVAVMKARVLMRTSLLPLGRRRNRPLVPDPAGLVTPHRDLHPVTGAELGHEATDVGLHGAEADMELGGD